MTLLLESQKKKKASEKILSLYLLFWYVYSYS